MLSSGAVIICVIIHTTTNWMWLSTGQPREENVTWCHRSLEVLLLEILINSLVCPHQWTSPSQWHQSATLWSTPLMHSPPSFRCSGYTLSWGCSNITPLDNERSKRVCKINEHRLTRSLPWRRTDIEALHYIDNWTDCFNIHTGFAIRIFEIGSSDSPFIYTWNAFWWFILTMTTIGMEIYTRD